MKPIVHARSSAKKYGGRVDDYLAIHDKIDSSKIAHAEVSHRLVFHSAFGVYLIGELFGETIINSAGKEVSVRDIAEQHILEDLGFIPSLSDWLHEVNIQPWMAGEILAFKERRRRVLSAESQNVLTE